MPVFLVHPANKEHHTAQVLHGFDTVENANAYLKSALFNNDVVVGLKPLLDAAPDVRVDTVA